MALSFSLSLSCARVNSHPSTLVVSAPHKTLILIPATPRNRRLSVQSRQSQSDFSETRQHFSSRPQEDASFASNAIGAKSAKVFVSYSIYKGKGALTVSPKAPEFSPLDSGAYKVAKEGYVFFEFAPGIGNRQFDWNRKQIFSLSVEEIGTLISLGPKDSCEFFHDPFIGRSEEGQVRKVLKAEPLPDGSGHFFNLSVHNRLVNVEESIYIPITKGEFAVLRSSLNYVIPYLLGWNTFANSIGPENSARLNNFRSPELEWGR